jgi:hypothetical protein
MVRFLVAQSVARRVDLSKRDVRDEAVVLLGAVKCWLRSEVSPAVCDARGLAGKWRASSELSLTVCDAIVSAANFYKLTWRFWSLRCEEAVSHTDHVER